MNNLFFTLLFSPLCCFGQLTVDDSVQIAYPQLILEGHFTGKNVYIINPDSEQLDSLEHYCTICVLVNGIEIPFSNSPAYEIDLISLGLALNTPILIEIVHYNDCKPRLIVQNGCLTGGN